MWILENVIKKSVLTSIHIIEVIVRKYFCIEEVKIGPCPKNRQTEYRRLRCTRKEDSKDDMDRTQNTPGNT